MSLPLRDPIEDARPQVLVSKLCYERATVLEHRAAVALVFEHVGGRARRGGKAGRDGERRHHAAERVDHR